MSRNQNVVLIQVSETTTIYIFIYLYIYIYEGAWFTKGFEIWHKTKNPFFYIFFSSKNRNSLEMDFPSPFTLFWYPTSHMEIWKQKCSNVMISWGVPTGVKKLNFQNKNFTKKIIKKNWFLCHKNFRWVISLKIFWVEGLNSKTGRAEKVLLKGSKTKFWGASTKRPSK